MKRRRLIGTLLAATLVLTCANTLGAETKTAPIKGNPNSKIYHKPACSYYKAKGCTQTFKDEAAAVAAGYKPCKRCCKPKAADTKKK